MAAASVVNTAKNPFFYNSIMMFILPGVFQNIFYCFHKKGRFETGQKFPLLRNWSFALEAKSYVIRPGFLARWLIFAFAT